MSCSFSLCDLAPQHHLFTLSSLFVPGVIALGRAILWSLESGVVLAQEDVYQVEYDGASKRNPGRAGAGALVRHPDGSVVSKFFLSLSTIKKNMAAEERKRGGLPGDFMANACSLFQCHGFIFSSYTSLLLRLYTGV
jgi:hypothetical protein